MGSSILQSKIILTVLIFKCCKISGETIELTRVCPYSILELKEREWQKTSKPAACSKFSEEGAESRIQHPKTEISFDICANQRKS